MQRSLPLFRVPVINKRLSTNQSINLKHRTHLNKVVRIDNVYFDFKVKSVQGLRFVYLARFAKKLAN